MRRPVGGTLGELPVRMSVEACDAPDMMPTFARLPRTRACVSLPLAKPMLARRPSLTLFPPVSASLSPRTSGAALPPAEEGGLSSRQSMSSQAAEARSLSSDWRPAERQTPSSEAPALWQGTQPLTPDELARMDLSAADDDDLHMLCFLLAACQSVGVSAGGPE